MRNALVERLVEVCRPDDNGKDAERSVAADEEPLDEGAGTPSSGGGRDSGFRRIRDHWTEGAAT